MKSNELLRHLRKLLALNETGMAQIFACGHYEVAPETVRTWLKQDNEADFTPCPDLALAHFLEGLIISRRGARERASAAPPPVYPVSNNQVLKKLRIAFELQGDDMHTLFEAAGNPLTKQELDALFRKPEHKNFQACSDQTLRTFVKALMERFRPH